MPKRPNIESYPRPLPEGELGIATLRARINAPGEPVHITSDDYLQKLEGVPRRWHNGGEGDFGAAMALGIRAFLGAMERHPEGKRIEIGGRQAIVDTWGFDHVTGRMKIRVKLLGGQRNGGEFAWYFEDEL